MTKSSQKGADNNQSMTSCPACGADLTTEESVVREYVNKSPDSVFSSGHYDAEGMFEPDRFDGFGGGNFDLLDDSDTCSACDEKL